MCSIFAILPCCSVLIGGLALILQFVVLPSDEWGYFISRDGAGQIREEGHFGLWRLCTIKLPKKNLNEEKKCFHPEDETYQIPTYASAAGASSIIHLLLLVSFVVLASIRVMQLAKDAPDLYLGTKRLCIVKVSLAVVCVLFSISTSILASAGEGTIRRMSIYKGWAFWLQIVIISLDIVLLLICAFENIQFWQIRMTEQHPKDVTDEFPETFIAPNYDFLPEPRDNKVVYVKDASVQSQLDNDGESPLTSVEIFRRNRDNDYRSSNSVNRNYSRQLK